jgi:hypothetical protein
MFIPMSPSSCVRSTICQTLESFKDTTFGQKNDNVVLVRNQSYQIDKFNLVACEGNGVAVRSSDLKANVTHLFKAPPKHHLHCQALSRFKSTGTTLEVVRGEPNIQGSVCRVLGRNQLMSMTRCCLDQGNLVQVQVSAQHKTSKRRCCL